MSNINDVDLSVYIVSDFTGNTANTLINAVAIQFDTERIKIKKFTDISTIDKLAEIIKEAKKYDNIILAYTLVLPELCDYIESKAAEFNIPTIDIMGPLINKFSQTLEAQPQLEVGLKYNLPKKSLEKIDCIQFSTRCDDGKNLNRLKEADLVLIGVSRTFKTPLSIYLSCQNYKVATISLAPEVEPPQELFDVDKKRVIGLISKTSNLQRIRQKRLQLMNFNQQVNYAQIDRIETELSYAKMIMKKVGCRIIEVTDKSIEEIAAEIEIG